MAVRLGVALWTRLAGLLPGAQERRRQVEAYAEEWRSANEESRALGRHQGGPGPLWVVLGDSTAQAVGASAIGRGYVGSVRSWLEERDAVPWRVANLSRSGARAADVLGEQLPAMAALAPDLVSCAVGANDLLRRSGDLSAALAEIGAALPPGSLLANLPRGLREARARQVNHVVTATTERHHLRLVDLWSATGPPWRGKYAADWFHPNDLGYEDWTAAFLDALALP